MRNTIDVLGIPVDVVVMNEALQKFAQFVGEDKNHAIYTPNAEIMMAAHRNPALKSILCNADLLVADGAGVVLASKILGKPLPTRVPGVDLVKNSFAFANQKKLSYFFLGGAPKIAETAAINVLLQYPDVVIAGCQHGYFSEEEEHNIIEKINDSKADILIVALGAPRQELWIDAHKDELKTKICIGVGGTLDILAGKAKLAPDFFRKHSLEWLYRLYKEPRRFKRMLDLPRYILLALTVRLRLTR